MTDRWTVRGNWPYFEVEPVGGAFDQHHTPNAIHGSKAAALAALIGDLTDTRRSLASEIARHKRALRRMKGPQ